MQNSMLNEKIKRQCLSESKNPPLPALTAKLPDKTLKLFFSPPDLLCIVLGLHLYQSILSQPTFDSNQPLCHSLSIWLRRCLAKITLQFEAPFWNCCAVMIIYHIVNLVSQWSTAWPTWWWSIFAYDYSILHLTIYVIRFRSILHL